MSRPLCTVCDRIPCAINYIKQDITHYRSRCSGCINKNKKKKPPIPRWHKSGYIKKVVCDVCGFKAKHASQIIVYHINGNLNSSELINLRSVCLNCSSLIARRNPLWEQGDLQADY